jgi:hypothetical protein
MPDLATVTNTSVEAPAPAGPRCWCAPGSFATVPVTVLNPAPGFTAGAAAE